MELLNDNPTKDDKYGFNNYATYFSQAIIDTKDLPFLMGIYGAWGSGKSSLMLLVQERLKNDGIKCIWFNPWKYDNKEDLWSALIQSILYKIADESPNKELVKKVKKLAGKVAWNFMKTGISTLTQGVITGKNLDNVKDTLMKENEEKIQYINHFEKSFEDAINDYTNGKKLVIFIDDLDRCSPDNAITVLESLKLFIGEANCVFLLGMDHQIIEQGIQYKYGGKINLSGREYLDKIIQAPFFIPPIPFNKLKDSVKHALKDEISESKPLWDLISTAFRDNPRKTKRFINSYNFVLQIVEHYEKFDDDIIDNLLLDFSDDSDITQDFFLAYLLIIQLLFPNFYEFIKNSRDFGSGLMKLVDNDSIQTEFKSSIELHEYKQLEEIAENSDLIDFLREANIIINENNLFYPTNEQIIALINTINLVSRSDSATTTTTTTINPDSSGSGSGSMSGKIEGKSSVSGSLKG